MGTNSTGWGFILIQGRKSLGVGFFFFFFFFSGNLYSLGQPPQGHGRVPISGADPCPTYFLPLKLASSLGRVVPLGIWALLS